jgi:hypothetical protein
VVSILAYSEYPGFGSDEDMKTVSFLTTSLLKIRVEPTPETSRKSSTHHTVHSVAVAAGLPQAGRLLSVLAI